MEDKREVKVIEYDSNWLCLYEDEKDKILSFMLSDVVDIYHIGSTAVPGMAAKPVIDIMIEINSIENCSKYIQNMEKIGYEYKGENGIPGRQFFIKGGNNRSHHVHIYGKGHPDIERHLIFKDFMINNTEEANKYAALKLKLAEENRFSIDNYVNGKDGFIKEMDKKAEIWFEERIEKLGSAFLKSWSKESSSKWTIENPAAGQCGVSALVVLKLLGGKILKTDIGGVWHFYNKINGRYIDFTSSQFGELPDYQDIASDFDEAFSDTNEAQYSCLLNKVKEHLEKI